MIVDSGLGPCYVVVGSRCCSRRHVYGSHGTPVWMWPMIWLYRSDWRLEMQKCFQLAL